MNDERFEWKLHCYPIKSFPTNYAQLIPTYILSLKTTENPKENLQRHIQNMWQEVISYLPCRFLSKEITKAVSNSKNESIH
jgi:hypothetical protein